MPSTDLKYKFGLINSAGKYLTAEKFGGKVNASGATLKAKQVWTLEQDEGSSISYLKAPSGNFLSADKNGNVYCEVEDRNETKDVGFDIELQSDGKWALKNISHQRFIGCNGDELTCTDSSTSNPSVHWIVQLAIHPQVCMRNVQHQRYAHLKSSEEEDEDRVVVDELVPWGADSTLTLVYLGKGKYALEAFNGKFVQSDGRLVQTATPQAQFTLIFISGHLALKDSENRYLGVDSGTRVLKSSTKTGLTKANYFNLEDSCPQGAFEYNERFASLKQGEDVSFKPHTDEIEDTETFQLEFVKTDTYAIRVCDPTKNSRDPKYWKKYPAGIQANGSSKDEAACQFNVEYDGKFMFLRPSGGKYVSVRDNGHLYLQDEKKGFIFRLLNRPKLVLKCTHGFVGMKEGKSGVDCNRSNFDVFNMTYRDGGYTIQDSHGKYWSADDSGRIVLGDAQGVFFLEYHELSKFAIRAESNGKLLKGEQSGLFTASGDEVSRDTLWEF